MTIHRLPIPGSDDGSWGDILNDFLAQSHSTDGSLKDGSVGTSTITDNAVTGSKVASGSLTDSHISTTAGISKSKLAAGVQTSLSSADSSVQQVNGKTPTSGTVTLSAADVGAVSKPAAGVNGKVVQWNNTSGQLEDASASLNGSYETKHSTVVIASGTADSAAIASAFNSMKVAGHAQGTLIIKGNAAIDTALVFDGGFIDVANSSDANAVGEAGRFTLIVDGVLNVTSGVGTAVTIQGFRGARARLNFTGGGSSDIALDIQNMVDFDLLWLYGNQFAGTLLHADASADTTKLVSESNIRSVHAQGCGQAVYFKGINAFGKIGQIQDIESGNGSVFDTCADIAIGYWNSYTPAAIVNGILFNNCSNMAIDTLEMGDRPTEALVKIVGGNFGRIGKFRVTGQPGIATPTISGLKLVDVTSIEVALLETANSAKGLHILGGGGASAGSIRVLHHRSLTNDINPLYVEAGTSTTTPLIEVSCRYRYNKAQAAYVASTITGGELHLTGLIDTPNSDGSAGVYAVDCQSTSMVVDVSGLRLLHRTTLAGAVNSATPTNIVGVSDSRLENALTHGEITAIATPNTALQGDWQNTTTRPVTVYFAIRFQPVAGDMTGSEAAFRMGRTIAEYQYLGSEVRKAETGATVTTDVYGFYSLRVPPWWYLTVQCTNCSVNTGYYVCD